MKDERAYREAALSWAAANGYRAKKGGAPNRLTTEIRAAYDNYLATATPDADSYVEQAAS